MVAYKTPVSELDHVFSSALKGLNSNSYEAHILDNANDLELQSWSKKNHYAYHHLGRNVGFARGHNEIFKKTYQKDTIYLFLNPDVEIKGAAIKKILAFFKKNTRVGILSPKLLNADGSIQKIARFIPNPVTLLKRFLLNDVSDTIPIKFYKQNFSAPFVHGACLFVKGNVFKKVGGFDERYFMYMEDLDLCRKVQSKNLSVMLFSEVTATHKHHKGSSKDVRLFFYHVQSLVRYFNRWGWFNDKLRDRMNESFRQRLYKKGL
jgi:GT2 family glycosyltransferase